jgi:hypothetical protein
MASALVPLIFCLAAAAAALDIGSDVAGYDSLLMQDLYKRLADIEPAYFLSRYNDDVNGDDVAAVGPEGEGVGREWDDSDEVRSMPRSPAAGGQTDIRDSEYIGHSSNAGSQGFIYMSGGAGEGQQHLTPSGALNNVHQVKSDEALPFYCHPPNPCPKGFTAEDGCQESIEDTAEMQKAWIEKMMQKGLCTCDEEHMYDCPVGDRSDTNYADSKSQHADTAEQQQSFSDVIDKILGDKHDSSVDNPFVGGQKRQSLVAKKSPRVKRDQTDDRIEKELDKLSVNAINAPHNPYLAGEKLRTVAKKGSPAKDNID